MSDQFEWKAEITFKGTTDEFNEMTALPAEEDAKNRTCRYKDSWHRIRSIVRYRTLRH